MKACCYYLVGLWPVIQQVIRPGLALISLTAGWLWQLPGLDSQDLTPVQVHLWWQSSGFLACDEEN